MIHLCGFCCFAHNVWPARDLQLSSHRTGESGLRRRWHWASLMSISYLERVSKHIAVLYPVVVCSIVSRKSCYTILMSSQNLEMPSEIFLSFSVVAISSENGSWHAKSFTFRVRCLWDGCFFVFYFSETFGFYYFWEIFIFGFWRERAFII